MSILIFQNLFWAQFIWLIYDYLIYLNVICFEETQFILAIKQTRRKTAEKTAEKQKE